MANEFKHKDPGGELTQAEFIAACGDGHIFASQATGDLVIADSATVLKRLARAGSGSQMLQIASCKPAWTATPSLGTTSWCNMNHAHGAGNSGGTVCANVLAGTTLKSTVVNSSLENVGTLTALQVDYINANASTLTITDSSDTGDLASLAVTTHGATTLTTTDDDATAAHFTVDADGNITLDAATGVVTIEDGGTEVLRFTESCSGDVTVKLVTNAKDLIFTDNGDAEGFRILDAAVGVKVAGTLDLGHATANTLSASSGVLSIEGNRVFHAGGTDIPVADGGTGASTFTANGILVGNGTSAVAVTATMATKGHVMIGDDSGVPSMLAVGNNCLVLTACSSEATGVKWAAAGICAANQAEQVAACITTKFTSPGTQKFHPGSAKAWASYEQCGTHSLLSSYNVSGLCDGGAAGDSDFAWCVDFSTVEYSIFGSGSALCGGDGSYVSVFGPTQAAATATMITKLESSNAGSDQLDNYVAAFGTSA